MVVAELIKASYANLGAVDIDDDLTPSQYAQGLLSLNSMIGSWSREKMVIYGLVDEHFTLTPSKAEYTVGSGCDFDTTWAFLVENAYIRDANNVDYPLQIITQNQYDNVSVKNVVTRPQYLLYNPKGYPTGLATLYYVPDQAYELYWTAQKLITSYANIEAEIGVAPEYAEAFEFNLSLRLAPKVGVPVTPELATLARLSKSVIPVVIEPASFDGAFNKGRRYSIFSDQI